MGQLARKATKIWNESKTIAWICVIAGWTLAAWAIWIPQSPGVSIGLLALVAGIMSLRPEMHIFEKAAWMALLIVFAILEVHAIRVSDEVNRAARDTQNREFSDIANGLKTSMAVSKDQYDSTIKQVNGVLKTTQDVSKITKQSLEDATGGDSFVYIDFPQPVFGFEKKVGTPPLSGVSVLIKHLVPGTANLEHPTSFYELDRITDTLGDFPEGIAGPNDKPLVYFHKGGSLGFKKDVRGEERIWYFLAFATNHRKWYEDVRLQKTGDEKWIHAIRVYKKVGKRDVVLFEDEPKDFPKDFPFGKPAQFW
jgi:hypothetical protein